MIDVHCHILPDFDDGSSCLAESLAMARMAADSGVTGIVVTPHFRGEASSLRELTVIVEKLEQLRDGIREEKLPLEIYPGAEILCLPETPYLATQGKLPTIADGSYLLTEFYFDESRAFINETLSQLRQQGYTPVIAHPERYAAVQRDIQLVQRWFIEGYVLQINKGSVLGAFGSRVRQTAHALLHSGLAHVLASDAHRADYRTPHMTALKEWAEVYLGECYAQILLEENPLRLVSGKPMVSPE